MYNTVIIELEQYDGSVNKSMKIVQLLVQTYDPDYWLNLADANCSTYIRKNSSKIIRMYTPIENPEMFL